VQVAQLGAVFSRFVEFQRQTVGVGKRQREAVTKFQERRVVELFVLRLQRIDARCRAAVLLEQPVVAAAK